MAQIKITVLKKTLTPLAHHRQRGARRPATCSRGQSSWSRFRQPADFPCGWAWNDLHRLVALTVGGDFDGLEPAEFITCCTAALPVFKVERPRHGRPRPDGPRRRTPSMAA